MRRQHAVQVLRVGPLGILEGELLRHGQHRVGVFLAGQDTEQRRKYLRVVEIAGGDEAVDIVEGFLDLVLADVDRGDHLARVDALGIELDPALRGLDRRLEILAVDRDPHRALGDIGIFLAARQLEIIAHGEFGIALVQRDFGHHQRVGGVGQRIGLRLQPPDPRLLLPERRNPAAIRQTGTTGQQRGD